MAIAAKERAIISLDVTVERAQEIVENTQDLISCYKVGPVLWMKWGKDCLPFFAKRGLKLMMDFKFHDIPNTVKESIGALMSLPGSESIWGMTVHTSGGYAMLKSAAEARNECKSKPKIFGVTVLTSLREKDLYRVGVNRSVEAQVKKLAALAQDADLDGVVASSREAETIRKACGKEFLILTPGIQFQESVRKNVDQKRPATPQEALKAGSNYLIVGRDIYLSDNPRAQAEALLGAVTSFKN